MDNEWFSGGKKANSWFTGGKGGGSEGFIARKKKELEEEEAKRQEAEIYNKQQQEEAKKTEEKKKNDGKNIFQKAGDVAGGVGKFVKDAAVDVKDTAVGSYQAIGDVARGELASNEMEKKTEERQKNTKQWSAYMNTLKEDDWKKPEVKKKLKEFSDRNKGIEVSKQSMDDLKKAQEVDPKKAAFQTAETFLNVATLGVGTPLKAGAKAGIKQGGKMLVKQAAKDVIKTGGTKLLEQTIKEGGEIAAKKAAQEVLEAGAKTAVKSTGKKLIQEAAKDATIGAAYGVTQTGKRDTDDGTDSDAKLDDYLINIAFGMGIGGAIPVVGAGAKKGFQKVTGKGAPTAEKIIADAKKNKTMDISKLTDYEGAPDRAQVELYKQKIQNGEKLPPLKVMPDSLGNVGVEDGKHRLQAYKELGIKKVPVEAVDAGDVNAQINRAIEEQSDKYGTTTFQRVKNWVGDQIDPNRAFAKVDDKYAKANKIQRNKLNADESLEDLARRSAVSEREAASIFEKKLKITTPDGKPHEMSAADLVKKYKGDSAEGMEFNNYTNVKFLKEIRAKKGNSYQLPAGLDDQKIDDFIASYEAKNPDALIDLKVKKAVNDEAVDYMVNSKVISAEDGARIKGAYESAVPLEKVFPDDLARPEVTGRNVGSIAKQTVVQRLETGSEVPLSNSFDTMLNRVYKATSQGNRAKLAQKLLERGEQGLIDGSNVVVTAGNKEARRTLRDTAQLVNRGVRIAENKVKISNRQIRSLESEINKLNKSGMNLSLKEGGQEALPEMAVDALSKLSTVPGKTRTSRAFFKSLIEADPKGMQAIRDKIAVRQPKLAAKLDEVANIRSQIDSLKAVKTDLKDITAEFVDDPTTGKQLISGIIDGQTYKMEVPPEIAKAALGLDQQKLIPVLKAFALAKKPFEVTWTGIFNPVFSAMSFAFYDTPMSIINSPQGFKTLGPKAVKEMFKSFKTSSEFQRRLAAEGARPYGGSGASAFLKPNAETIAAQRSLLSNLKYTTTHPEAALSKLDVWGGKLANATRTRIARAEYDDAIKRGLTEKQAMEQATLAYRSIMPDFDTMSNLTRQINSVVPFYSASTAGMRSFGKALKRDPVGTSAKALALGIAPTTAVTAFSLMQPAGQEFYDDMERSGNKRTLDDNMIIVLPGAHKDDKTGEWKGIIKVPLAPEFRSINQSVWRGTRQAMGKGNGPGPSHVALSIFDTITGGIRSSENPLISTRRILSGEDPRTGERIIKGDMENLPKEEQVYDTTSGAGKFVGKVFGTSPIQGDKLLSQFGLLGQTAKNGGKPVEAITSNVENRLTGAFGERAADSFYEAYSPLKAKRDKASREVTDLVKQGKINEAKRRANEFNESMTGKFSDFSKNYSDSEALDPDWEEMMKGLIIKTSENAFKAREKL